jgi:hypothetical protein
MLLPQENLDDLQQGRGDAVGERVRAVGATAGDPGPFGAIAYMVAHRRNEIGVRIALGADRSRVIRLVLCEAMMLLGWGCRRVS